MKRSMSVVCSATWWHPASKLMAFSFEVVKRPDEIVRQPDYLVKELDDMLPVGGGMAKTEMNAGEAGFARRGEIPLIALLSGLARWMEERHFELMAEEGFDDLRRAHNAVAANLPAQGLRLTELAERAGLTKQAVGEIVDDAV